MSFFKEDVGHVVSGVEGYTVSHIEVYTSVIVNAYSLSNQFHRFDTLELLYAYKRSFFPFSIELIKMNKIL